MPLQKSDLDVLEKQSKKTLARFYCELNSWGWPNEIPSPEDPYLYRIRGPGGPTRRYIIMSYIVDCIGQKECSRYWKVYHQKTMSNRQFKRWWKIKNHNTFKEKLLRYINNICDYLRY